MTLQNVTQALSIFLAGPSVAYDANWVGGMEVIRMAYEAIKTGQCESVIVGTANLALNAEFQWLYTDMGLLSPDGSTRAFDVDGNKLSICAKVDWY